MTDEEIGRSFKKIKDFKGQVHEVSNPNCQACRVRNFPCTCGGTMHNFVKIEDIYGLETGYFCDLCKDAWKR